VPGWPEGHRNADRPGYDALVQAASGQQWEQPGWRPGPIFLAMPMPSMGAIYLVASGVLAALVARESTGRGQHVRTSLLQGVFLYTTQIWQEAERADAAYYGLMAKSHPPGIHQGMLFECANREFVHVSIMSGLTPLKSLDDVLGVEAPPPSDLAGLLPLEQQLLLNERRREAFLRWPRDKLVAELLANNHAVEAVVEPEDQFGHPQLQANGMVAVLDDPDADRIDARRLAIADRCKEGAAMTLAVQERLTRGGQVRGGRRELPPCRHRSISCRSGPALLG